ncbi:Nudix family hydrolase [Amphritea opalescens]|uniref:Nudix family hydrolase n=1 Tax=Amphritea opalescens TaxID=2490544 RepID=UPI001F493405|nr:Nudix family hydrolase [Amphritea opalescens]
MIHVAAAAIFNESGELLLALRHQKQHQGGLWEFPGGKVEAGETVRDALARELQEELGIEIDPLATTPLIQVPYHYPDKSVLLDVYRVNRFSGEAYGREGQPLKWIQLSELTDYHFPAANQPIVNALLLPATIAITPALAPQEYSDFIDTALLKGAGAVMLRAKHLSDAEQLSLYTALSAAYEGLLLIWNTSIEAANTVASVHLSSDRLMQLDNRADFKGRWLSASCHSSEQIKQAERLGLDYITLSPVQQTASHPDASPLGWDEFRRLVSETRLPVYALGGVSVDDLEKTIEAGGQGIAAISGFRC